MSEYVLFEEFSRIVDLPQLNRARQVMRTFDPTVQHYTINEILQFYAILRHIESDHYSSSSWTFWTPAEKQAFIAHKQPLLALLRKYAADTNEQNFTQRTMPLDAVYHDSFVAWFNRFQIYNTVSPELFMDVAQKQGIAIRSIVAVENIVKRYPKLVKVAFLREPRNAEILIDKYVREVQLTSGDPPLHLPANLTDAEKITLVEQYVDGPEAHSTYLRLLKNMPKVPQLPLPPKVKLKVVHREQEATKETPYTRNNAAANFKVKFVDGQEEAVVERTVDGRFERHFSKPWLEAHVDYNTILQNFIHLFKHADTDMRLTLCERPAESGLTERYLSPKARHNYNTSFAFTGKETLADAALWNYYRFLHERGIMLEDVISWFFAEYVPEWFKITGFTITMPSKRATYKERCHSVAAEMEGILHQFTLYVHEGTINPELLALSAEQIRYARIPSLITPKYAYAAPTSTEIGPMLFLLFDEQVGLGYLDEARKEDNLFTLISRHNVYYADFILGRNAMIDRLIKQKLLKKDRGGRLNFDNTTRLIALYRLSETDFINYYRLPPEVRTEVDAMVAEGLLITNSTLLAAPEAAYFNYYLNKAQFANGPSIRNHYSHGATFGTLDENEHRRHYITLLKLLIIIIIKINDELCIREDCLKQK